MTLTAQNNIIIGFKVLIFSEVMAFISLFWALTHFGLVPSIFILINFPPLSITALFPFSLPWVNVLTLIYSSMPLQAAQIWLKKGANSRTLDCLSQTLYSSGVFLYLQLIEYSAGLFTISDSMFGSTFYSTTGLHGLHVCTGAIAFTIMYFIIGRIVYKDLNNSFKLWAWYWHMADFIWILVLSHFYLWAYTW